MPRATKSNSIPGSRRGRYDAVDTSAVPTWTPFQYYNDESPVKKGNKKHVCSICTKSFTTSGHLSRHMRVHTGERNHKCPFPGCQTRCSRQDNLQQHYRTHLGRKNKSVESKSRATTADVMSEDSVVVKSEPAAVNCPPSSSRPLTPPLLFEMPADDDDGFPPLDAPPPLELGTVPALPSCARYSPPPLSAGSSTTSISPGTVPPSLSRDGGDFHVFHAFSPSSQYHSPMDSPVEYPPVGYFPHRPLDAGGSFSSASSSTGRSDDCEALADVCISPRASWGSASMSHGDGFVVSSPESPSSQAHASRAPSPFMSSYGCARTSLSSLQASSSSSVAGFYPAMGQFDSTTLAPTSGESLGHFPQVPGLQPALHSTMQDSRVVYESVDVEGVPGVRLLGESDVERYVYRTPPSVNVYSNYNRGSVWADAVQQASPRADETWASPVIVTYASESPANRAPEAQNLPALY